MYSIFLNSYRIISESGEVQRSVAVVILIIQAASRLKKQLARGRAAIHSGKVQCRASAPIDTSDLCFELHENSNHLDVIVHGGEN